MASVWSMVWFVGSAAAHDFETHTIDPTDDWCAQLHAVAQPADVVELGPGTYAGGCDLTLGGLIDLNEALLVKGDPDGGTVIAPDAQGLSLRLSAQPIRLFEIAVEGRLEVAADGATIDRVAVTELTVLPEVSSLTVLFSELSDLEIDLDNTVIRGNHLDSLWVAANTGLVADNVVGLNAVVTVPFERNLVLGDLDAMSDAFANVVVGSTHAPGRLYGNTLLGPVLSAADARNNLTTQASLSPSDGNLHCAECVIDAVLLDVRPMGQALDSAVVDAPDDDTDFCGVPRQGIGAVGADAPEQWTAFDRDATGCVEGAAPETSEFPTADAPPGDDPGAERPSVDLAQPAGCQTAPHAAPTLLTLVGLALIRTRTRSSRGWTCDP